MVIVWLRLKWSKRDSSPALHFFVKIFHSLEIRNWEAGGAKLDVCCLTYGPTALLCMASGTLSSCVPGQEDFQWQGIYSARAIKREGNLWRTCLLTVWTTVFISFISSRWNTRWRPEQSLIKVSSMVTRHTQFSSGPLSPLWHPKLLVKKVLRARAGLAQKTVSRVCWSRWIKSIFSLSEGGNAAQSSMPKALLEYLGVELTVPLHHFTLDRIVSYNYKSKAKWSWVLVSHPPPSSFTYSSLGKHHHSCVNTEDGEEPRHIWHHWLHLHQEIKQGRAWALTLTSECPHHHILSMLTDMILAPDS